MRLAMRPAYGQQVYDIDTQKRYWFNGIEWETTLDTIEIPPRTNTPEAAYPAYLSSGGHGGGGGGGSGPGSPPVSPPPGGGGARCFYNDGFATPASSDIPGYTIELDGSNGSAWGVDSRGAFIEGVAVTGGFIVASKPVSLTGGTIAFSSRVYLGGAFSGLQIELADSYADYQVVAGLEWYLSQVLAAYCIDVDRVEYTMPSTPGWYTIGVQWDLINGKVRVKAYPDGSPDPGWLAVADASPVSYPTLILTLTAGPSSTFIMQSYSLQCLTGGDSPGFPDVEFSSEQIPDPPCATQIEDPDGDWDHTGPVVTVFPTILPPNVTYGTFITGALPQNTYSQYHVDHLLGHFSLPDDFRSEAAESTATLELGQLALVDPDEFVWRGHIKAANTWEYPEEVVGSSGLRFTGSLRARIGNAAILAAGRALAGIELAHETQIIVSEGGWGFPQEIISIRLYRPNAAAVTVVLVDSDPTVDGNDEGDFIISRSVNRGTTQLWYNDVLITEVPATAWVEVGDLTMLVDPLDVGCQTDRVEDLPMGDVFVSITDMTLCPIPAGGTFQFTNESTPMNAFDPAFTFWDFGDGDDVTGVENPQHTYAASGDYDVDLFMYLVGSSAEFHVQHTVHVP